jgi:hypothetical protein
MERLPDDVVRYLLCKLGVAQLVSMRAVSQRMLRLASENAPWAAYLTAGRSPWELFAKVSVLHR